MTHTSRTEKQELSLLIGGLLAIFGLMLIASMALMIRELSLAAGLLLVGMAVAGRRKHVPTVLFIATSGFGAVLLYVGVMRVLA